MNHHFAQANSFRQILLSLFLLGWSPRRASLRAASKVDLDVLKVAMRPGKPVKIGMIGTMLFAGLPGSPNAALVTRRRGPGKVN